MSDMAKYSFLTRRSGSLNWYYKRDVPPELHAPGRSKQIWKSLRTPDRKRAERAYAATHADIELKLEQWRKEDNRPIAVTEIAPSASDLPVTPLTPALLRRLADDHYLNIYENDFTWRGSLWLKASAEEDAFWQGDIIKHPTNDWQKHRGQSYSYYALLMEEPVLEEVFLYSVYTARKEKLQALRRLYQLGDTRDLETSTDDLLGLHRVGLSDGDRNRLLRKLMQTEIKVLEDLSAGDEATFDGIVASQVPTSHESDRKLPTQPLELASVLVEKYIEITSREREWPKKTELRKRSELREFLEICGDKPINAYRQEDGVKFKDVESALPLYRQKALFQGLSLIDAAKKAAELLERKSTGENPLATMSPEQHDADIQRVTGEKSLSKIARDFGFDVETVRTCAMKTREVQKDWWLKHGAQRLGPSKDVTRLAEALHRIKKRLRQGGVANRLRALIDTTAGSRFDQDLAGLDRIVSLLRSGETVVGKRLGRARCDWRLMVLHPRALHDARQGWARSIIKRGSHTSSIDFVYEIMIVADPSVPYSSIQNLLTELKGREEFGLKDLDATRRKYLSEYIRASSAQPWGKA